jgi:hypothetical protein
VPDAAPDQTGIERHKKEKRAEKSGVSGLIFRQCRVNNICQQHLAKG